MTSITIALITSVISISCGPRFAPRLEVPAEHAQSNSYRQAYTAFWWNCAIVKSVDLAAACPKTCSKTPAETAGCAAGGADAENQIAELEKKYGPERTQEILSLRIGEDDGHSHVTPYFPFGPTSARPPFP